MTSTLRDFLQKSDLAPLATVVQVLQAVAQPLGIDYFLMGAAAHMDCDNFDRAAQDHRDLFTKDDYDHEATGARLLGRDIANILGKRSIERVLSILLPQADTDGPLLLAQQSGLDLENARRLIEALCDGLTDNL